ncbi:DNA gyrase inhibitor YacG [Teredinibacter purpureus]|uniref:DNA gyrase inhibitor YacG n=1 Tax=Teredinibacter purpureus TaxID=2731756 RepID=UPI0005F8084D|nr:DNA gyrase inhibitor YacG [Teredinibacter purpureus]
MTLKTLSVKCPTCSKPVLMTNDFPERPFCSERCKLIDFGEWASENHRIDGNELEDDSWSNDLQE